MIGNTPFNTILIRLSILAFRSVTPICTVLSLGSLAALFVPSRFFPQSTSLHLPISKVVLIPILVITASEPLFYALVHLPRLHYLQKRTIPLEGTTSTKPERQELAKKFIQEIHDVKFWFSMWYRLGEVDDDRKSVEVRKSAVREWIAWGVFNRYSLSRIDADDRIELDEYVAMVQEKSGGKVKLLEDHEAFGYTGTGNENFGKPIRVTIDPMRVLHRPLLYYVFGVGLIDTVLFLKMWRMGFQHFPLRRNFSSFPWRPLSSLAKQRSPTGAMSYWHRPHTSRKHLPILYIHGIGVGLITYADFFAELISRDAEIQDGQVGILAIEVMQISFRLTSPIPHSAVIARQIGHILQHHGWDKTNIVLAANSYGTIIATHLLRCASVAPYIGPMILIDPVTLWAHMGDVAYNFTVKQPRSASEWQLWYFACTDMMAAHTVTRRFDWRDNVLWRDEIREKKVGIVLGGSDIILDAQRLRRFLAGEREGINIGGIEGADMITVSQEAAEGWEILWLKHLNHAEVFERQAERRLLVDMVWKYCSIEQRSH